MYTRDELIQIIASAARPGGWVSARIFLRIALCLFLAFSTAGVSICRELDRLLVAVNGKVLTEGDLELARNLNEILSYDKTGRSSSRDEEIVRLVDLELMRQELKNFSANQEDESRIVSRLRALREAYAGKGGLSLLLRHLGLQESELVDYLRFESSMLRFVDFRFRPFVAVSKEDIRAYYETRLAPQLRKARLDQPVLEQVSAKIEEIVREEKINAVLDQWIRDIKRNSRIEYFDAAHQPGHPLEGINHEAEASR